MTTYNAYADALRPTTRARWLYDALLVIVGSVLIALSAQVSVILPFSPVPVTGQTFAVLMIGALYGRVRGMATVAAYLAQGAAGMPVFANGLGGAAVFAGPTGGYLAGFVLAAGLVGWLAERGWDRAVLATVAAMILGNVVIYLFGATNLVRFVGAEAALSSGVLPFLAGDAVKIALAAALLPMGWRILGR